VTRFGKMKEKDGQVRWRGTYSRWLVLGMLVMAWSITSKPSCHLLWATKHIHYCRCKLLYEFIY